MIGDTLFLVEPDFEDPAYPDRRFYCWHCALLEGVLAAFPVQLESLEVIRVPWPRPRQAVIDAVGTTDQSLPLLLLGDAAGTGQDSGPGERQRIADKDEILAVLAERFGIPCPHP